MSAPVILIADDSATIRMQVSRVLTDAGYSVITASDGSDAVRLARKTLPDLAIVDVQMPKFDGYWMCQHLKRLGPPWSEIPIVFLTGTTMHAVKLLGDELGAYLRKPVTTDRLLQTVREFLPCSETAETTS